MRCLVIFALAACSAHAPTTTTETAGSAPPPPVTAEARDASHLPVVDGQLVVDAPGAPAVAARVELTFVGDLMFGGYFDDHYDPQYPERHDPLTEVDGLLASDLVLGNLETTITRSLPNSGGPHDGKGHKRFVTLPERVAVLTRHHIKTVTLANNHQLDNDTKGLSETPAILDELGIAYVGAARSAAPGVRIETLTAGGWKVAVIAATTQMNRGVPAHTTLAFVRETDLRSVVVPLVEQARRDHDLVFAVLHWGYEYQDIPARWQIDAAHAIVDAGADAVIGHHPHVLQPFERYRDALIAYSLGNFVFPNGKERIRETGVLRLGWRREGDAPARGCLDRVRLHPAIQVRQPITHPVVPTPAQRSEFAKRWFALSAQRPFATTWRIEGNDFTVDAACK